MRVRLLSGTIVPMTHVVGTPLGIHPSTVLLLGSGELGKEIAIQCMRLGLRVCAADSYENAPAQQVAHESRTLAMTDADALAKLIEDVNPSIIVPEVEAIATDVLADAAKRGIRVVPAAAIVRICMDRERLRVFAHGTLGLPTSEFRCVGSLEELRAAVGQIGLPCVVKPVMSSSGHGQSVVRDEALLDQAWAEAQHGRRGADQEGAGTECRGVVERLVDLAAELTMLTVGSSSGVTVCAPIGQWQQDGDYRQSWQPAEVPDDVLEQARRIARRVVEGLMDEAHAAGECGWGVYGVELFVLRDGSVLFNEVSPRPHDTGMVTMASQRCDEFMLHVRAMLGLPVTPGHVELVFPEGCHGAASQAIVVCGDGEVEFSGLEEALAGADVSLRVFAKPCVHGSRRMGVMLATGADCDAARKAAQAATQALLIAVVPSLT